MAWGGECVCFSAFVKLPGQVRLCGEEGSLRAAYWVGLYNPLFYFPAMASGHKWQSKWTIKHDWKNSSVCRKRQQGTEMNGCWSCQSLGEVAPNIYGTVELPCAQDLWIWRCVSQPSTWGSLPAFVKVMFSSKCGWWERAKQLCPGDIVRTPTPTRKDAFHLQRQRVAFHVIPPSLLPSLNPFLPSFLPLLEI